MTPPSATAPAGPATAAGDAAAEALRGAELLIEAVRTLSAARSAAEVQEIVRHAARSLTGADGATFVLRDGDRCHYVDEDAIAPLWKGQRFPLASCISGWAMVNRRSVVIEDVYADPRIPHDAYRPTFVHSLAMVPIRTANPVGAIGNYWARHHLPTAHEMRLLQALADSTAVALENVRVLAELEARVAERTRSLMTEIAERQLAEQEIRRLSITDELTGLHNRRGFHLLAEQALRVARRTATPSLLVFADIDDLKAVNDGRGHDAGDELIRAAARALREATRESDVLGRVGGDEFCLLVAQCGWDAEAVLSRIRAACAGATPSVALSLGTAVFDPWQPSSLESLLARADRAMYDAKRAAREAGAA